MSGCTNVATNQSYCRLGLLIVILLFDLVTKCIYLLFRATGLKCLGVVRGGNRG
jgi:hypothetical protein